MTTRPFENVFGKTVVWLMLVFCSFMSGLIVGWWTGPAAEPLGLVADLVGMVVIGAMVSYALFTEAWKR